jgi:hypothetical protein
MVVGWLAAPAAALAISVFVAAPWLEQRLAWSAWVGVAAALLLAGRARGWWGEFWTIAGATAAIAAAFHWTPKVLAFALDAPDWVGLSVAAPIVLWDALRLAAPILFVARLRTDPLAAWLPAGLLAVVLEATMPAVFPWKLGYAQIAWPWLVQAADLFGPEFSTLVLYAHAGLLAWVVHLLAASGSRSLLAAAMKPPRAVVAAAVLCAAATTSGSTRSPTRNAFWNGRGPRTRACGRSTSRRAPSSSAESSIGGIPTSRRRSTRAASSSIPRTRSSAATTSGT